MSGSFPSFGFLRTLSFVHSTVYLALLVFWIVPGCAVETDVCGWGHGVLWIVMSFLCIVAARRGTIPFWLAVVVAVIGGVGPFAGSVGFIVEQRRRAQPAPA